MDISYSGALAHADHIPAVRARITGKLTILQTYGSSLGGNHGIRLRLGIDSLQVIVGQNEMLGDRVTDELAEVTVDLHILLEIFVYGERGSAPRFLRSIPVQHPDRGVAVGLTVVDRTFYQRVQDGSAAVGTGVGEGIEDRLSPGSGIGGHDRSDHVDQLGQAGDLDTVCVAKKGDEKASHEKGILKVVDILQLVRRFAPFLQLFIGFMGVVPDVPFVKGEVDLFLRRVSLP